MNNEHRDGGEFQEIDTVADQKRHDAWLLSRGLTHLSTADRRKAIDRMHSLNIAARGASQEHAR